MRRVTYKSVLDQAALIYTGKTTITPEVAAGLRIWINRCAQAAWRFTFWPELCPSSERRYFAPLWSPSETVTYSTPTAPVWRYYPAEDKYYQALRGTNEQPDTSDHWAEAAASYDGDWHSESEVYVTGDVVRSPYDNRYYQAWTTPTAAPGLGNAPEDTGWGLLTPWVPEIRRDEQDQEVIDAIGQVWAEDPTVNRAALSLRWTQTHTGFLIHTTQTSVWVHYRPQPPEWSGAAYASGTTYSEGDQVWDATTGDYYASLQDTNTGHAVTDTTYWERIDFPWVLRDAVSNAAAAAAAATDTGDGAAAWSAAQLQLNGFLAQQVRESANRQSTSGLLNVRA